MSFDIQQVENLNRKAQQLNSDRQQKLGMQKAARQAYERAVYAYEQKYGVKLDDTNLQQEYDSVHATLEQAYNQLNQLVLSIENGEFAQQATPTITPSAPIQAQTQVPQPTGSFGATTQAPQGSTALDPLSQTQVSPELSAQASMQAMNQPTPPSFDPASFNPAGVGASTQPIAPPTPPVQPSGQQDVDPSEQTFTPQGWGTPNAQPAPSTNGKPFGF